MKPFTVAFPLSCALEEAPQFLLEKLNIDMSKKQVMIPGSSLFYTPILQGAAEGLESIFAEHAPLTDEESKILASHKSLFFLEFFVKSADEFKSFLLAAKKVLDAGAMGVYVENSGCAWTAKAFADLTSGEVPMEAFVNVIETSDSLFTLGLEPFGLPDLCTAVKAPLSVDECRSVLIAAAASIFEDGAEYESGAKWKDEDREFEFKKEAKAPFSKDAPEFNAQGYARLVLRSK